MVDPAPFEEDPAGASGEEWAQEFLVWKQKEAIRWAGHEFDEDGIHDEDACEVCLLAKAPSCSCRCGQCCHLLIEVSLRDAQREPRIAELGSPLYASPAETSSGRRELNGYLLNTAEAGFACVFLDQTTNLCTIYDTRPLVCRIFDCDGEGRDHLIELGWLPPNHSKGDKDVDAYREVKKPPIGQ
jgi:Fe-S-cluster containining protein